MDKFVKSLSSGKGALTIFWSYYFGNIDIRSERNKNMDINEYGLECAIAEQFVEAISFFWNKLPEVKKNLDTLMKVALYDSITGSATSDMILFCLNEVNRNKLFKFDNSEILYKEFLRKDYEKNGYYSTLDKLIYDKYFKDANRLFKYIEKKYISEENYSVLMSIMLQQVSLLPNNSSLIDHVEDILNSMWNGMEENHRKFFLHEIGSQYSPMRSKIFSIINDGKIFKSKVLTEIVSSLEKCHIESIFNFDRNVYNVILNKNLFKLESLKHIMNSINNGESSMVINPEKLGDFKIHLSSIIKKMEK
ncbi:MAG: hypothetical protein AB2993_07325 (plasmid) [Candidatus Symbiodolus clandestinus]